MPTLSQWINDSELRQSVDSLQPTPGYCIFIDIVGSTKMKEKKIGDWIILLNNFFRALREPPHLYQFKPLKVIGDAVMYYIEDSELKQSAGTPFSLFHSLWLIATENRREIIPEVRIGAVRCNQAYSLTFMQGNQDYYGIDIDLAARLQTYAQPGEVVIERRFYDEIAVEHKAKAASFFSVIGPRKVQLKGFTSWIDVFHSGR
jgi:class 3 adenylate cyclase